MRKSLRYQLLSSHLVLVGLMLVVMLIAVAGFFRLGQSVDRILRDNYKSVEAAQNMKEALERMDSAAALSLAGRKDQARRQFEENSRLFAEAYHVEATNITEPGEQALADDLGGQFAAYRANLRRLVYEEPPPRPDARTIYLNTLQPAFVRVKQRAQDVLDLNQAAILRADRRAKAEARAAASASIAITAAALLLGLGLAWRMSRAITAPLVSLTRQAEEVGAGHLNQSIEVRRADEIGLLARTFNEMATRLREAQHAAEERLHRAERMSDAALEHLYDPVVVTDAAGRVVHLNRAAEGLFGPAARARGQWARAVVQQDRLARAVERAVKQEQVSAEEGEAAQVRLLGRTYRLRASPMADADGSLLGAVAVLEDVTHLTELDRLKTEFIGVASHELRTPVTSLLLSVQLLREGAAGPLTPGQAEVVEAQRQDLERLERMMRNLLDLTRLEAGAVPPRFEVVPPADLARQAADAVQPQAAARAVTLTVRAADDLPSVRADPGQIGRVLVNLLGNAVRHTPDGGAVTLSAEPEASGFPGVRFSVRDTGSGIPRDYLPLIFQRFVQVPGATRGGSGLGLSLSQAIVRAHGGEIHVESVVGQGSTFWFTLPAAAAATASAAAAEKENTE